MGTTILVVIFMLVTRGGAKDDLENIVNEMKEEMRMEMNERLALNEEKMMKELKQTQGELLELKTENVQLKLDMSFLKDPPFFHACGYQGVVIKITGQTVPYKSLLYSSTNIEGGDLDIDTGILTTPQSGSYTVTWSLSAEDDAGDTAVQVLLRKNGQNIVESEHVSYYSGSTGVAWDQGGRTMILHLAKGDTLDLYCIDCSAGIGAITFCASLSTSDVE
eukprot:TRINITY_DN3970_c0_g1_i1.p1 TRINITY_DN3970_c0_g1~~TRINITY_DN3970_c0_g1_i1.p1  ORF type:complete len:239 (-),score=71.74 TRINITY_DN3970_c0_g1_i1:118-777(-)